jgi:hypothetical protein
MTMIHRIAKTTAGLRFLAQPNSLSSADVCVAKRILAPPRRPFPQLRSMALPAYAPTIPFASARPAVRKAIRKSDPTETLTDIDKWLRREITEDPICLICRSVLIVHSEKSPDRETHFAHKPASQCATIDGSHKPYTIFGDVERTTAEDARKIKSYALDNIESIYYRAAKLCPQLSWKEFLPLLDTAHQLNLWAIKDLNPLYLPYLLLCCADQFAGLGKASRRPKTIFFVLEPNAGAAEYWHLPSGPKQRIWRVEQATKDFEEISMVLAEIEPWYRLSARSSLKL